MSEIFELFGYRLTDQSDSAEQNRKTAHCPFMGCDCDGGGNRYLSQVDLTNNDTLGDYFQGRITVPSGVCSLQLRPDDSPWIVCPRRLLFLGKAGAGERGHQSNAESLLFQHAGFESRTQLGVWSEIRISYRDKQKLFLYTFDYILMPLRLQNQHEIEQMTGQPWEKARRILTKAGYSIVEQGGVDVVEEFPVDNPLIVEVMTSSTSGGNKAKRTTIPMAFEDAILGKPHAGPGINYRQVWARMVSQLIAKSEVGTAWGGKTIWILQDQLVDYISSSTALNLEQFTATQTSEVNILSFSYGEISEKVSGVIEFSDGFLFAGPIQSNIDFAPSFIDMIRVPVCPPKSILLHSLMSRQPVNKIVVP